MEKGETQESVIESEMEWACEVYERGILHVQIREREEREGVQRIR